MYLRLSLVLILSPERVLVHVTNFLVLSVAYRPEEVIGGFQGSIGLRRN